MQHILHSVFIINIFFIGSLFSQITVDVPCTGPTNPNSGRVFFNGSSYTKSYGYMRHGESQQFRSWARFDIQNYIPANATITAAEITFWVQTSSGSAANTYTRIFTTNPGTRSAVQLWGDIGGTNVHGATTPNLNPAGQKLIAMNAAGVTLLNNNKTIPVNVGFSRQSGNFGFTIYGTDGVGNGSTIPDRRPVLRITYTIPCTPSTPPLSITNSSCSAPITLTTIGGTLGTDAIDVWYEGACGVEAFSQEWTTQPYTTLSTNINSVNAGLLNVTSTSVDPQINMFSIGSYDPNVYRFINVRYRVTAGVAGFCEIFFNNATFPVPTGAQDYTNGPLISDGQWHVLNIDMPSFNPNYLTGGNITGWRFDWATADNVTMDIDFITLSDRPIIGAGSSITVSPTTSTTYFTAKKGDCNVTSCVSRTINILNMTSPTSLFEVCNGSTLDLAVTGQTDWSGLPTGGIITTIGNDRIHTFTSSGTFNTPQVLSLARLLVIGGGGGGGQNGGGGGGAGGVYHTQCY